MKQKFLDHIEYGRFDDSFPNSEQLAVTKLCEDHLVDVDYGKDRVAFFAAIIEQMENPYKWTPHNSASLIDKHLSLILLSPIFMMRLQWEEKEKK